MKTKKVVVSSPSFENDVFAELLLCDCGENEFMLYFIHGTDLHLECLKCHASYCQSAKCLANNGDASD